VLAITQAIRFGVGISTVCLNAKVICNLPKNSNSSCARLDEAIKDSFAGVIEELGNGN